MFDLDRFVVDCRAALAADKSHKSVREVVARAQQHFGIDPEPFVTLLNLREGKANPKEAEPEKLLAAYMKQIGAVIDRVDVLAK